MDITEQMKDFSLFAGISAEKLHWLGAQATYKTFKQGEMVIGETDPVRSFYVVVSGQLKLYRSSAEGKEQTLQLLGPGDPFGLCTAFATDSFPASAMAIEKSAVLLIPGTVMEATARQEPVLLLNIIQILSQRLKDSMTLIESLALKEIPGRLASFLNHELLRNAADKKTIVELTLSQRELAKILGATPETLSRALRKMANDGILATAGRTITILDHKALEQLAEGE
ncbi:MAG: Crp/Fnr family transcriptional regulator [Deltaproteobacteria bacterium HGW-Deltaproteobacteria-9]|nr:MAG: Crp/Fnr family transcriptional regulator [Deltaproteobacteria bacterium HGW-Deltaproteobacteria-9]